MLIQTFLYILHTPIKIIYKSSQLILLVILSVFASSSYVLAGSISGIVSDSTGLALEGVNITLSEKGDGFWFDTGYSYTDDTGKYNFKNLSANDYRIRFNAHGYVYEYYNNARYEDQAESISLATNENIVRDIALEKKGILRGTVKDASGQVLENLKVTTYYESIFPDGSNHWWKTTRYTDEQGQYVFDSNDGLEPGRKYRLSFSNRYHGSSYYEYGIEFYNDVATLDSATDIIMMPGEERIINTVLGDLGRGTISGTVTDNVGTAIPNAYVSIYFKDGDKWNYFDRTETDTDGKYSYINLPVNEYRISFSANISISALGERFIAEYFDNATNEELSTPIVVSAGENSIADAQLDKLGILRGTVTDVSGKPIESVVVDIFRAYEDAEGTLIWSEYPASTRYTNSDGQYAFNYYDSLEPGVKYRLRFFNIENGLEFYQDVATFDTATDIVMQANEVRLIDVVLGDVSSGTINGTVTDNDSKIIEGITVSIKYRKEGDTYWNNLWTTKTDSQGEYSFKGLEEGEYSIQFYDQNNIYLPEYFDNATDQEQLTVISLAQGETTTANALLDKHVVLRGTVKGLEGQVLNNIQVDAYYFLDFGDGSGIWIRDETSNTDSDGKYVFEGYDKLNSGEKYRIKFTSFTLDEYGDRVESVYEFYDNVATIEEATDIVVNENDLIINATLEVSPPEEEVEVNVVATDGTAFEAGGDNGLFTITRSGSTELPLIIRFGLSGTAQPDIDYKFVGEVGGSGSSDSDSPYHQQVSYEIPAGESSVSIEIIPIDDNDKTESDETVILTLFDPVSGTSASDVVGKFVGQRMVEKVGNGSATIIIVNNAGVQAIPTLHEWALILLLILLLIASHSQRGNQYKR